jgi:ADP-ribosylglycohydrolase
MIGGGPFGLSAGQWTDDTSMALCLAESLVETGTFDPLDQIRRYVRWYRTGYLSSTGRCFDIGHTTRAALHRFERTGEAFAGSDAPDSAGNGSIMRLAPVPMFYASHLDLAVAHSVESSRTTHSAKACLDACRVLGGLLALALSGAPKEDLVLDYPDYPQTLRDLWEQTRFGPRLREVVEGSYRWRSAGIRARGYVIDTLEAALWAFYNGKTFQEGALLAVNLGEDADTVGAVYGQLAGAHYGLSAIPPQWVERLSMRDRIIGYADGLFEKAQ